MTTGTALLTLTVWFAAGTWAATVQNFDSPGTSYTAAQCNPALPDLPLPTIKSGGPNGKFIRLVTTTPGNHNTVTFDPTDSGAFGMVVADFDFRVTPGPPGRADGFGIALLNTESYPDTPGEVCLESPLFAAEETNFAGSLGVGFDIYTEILPAI